ncbi:MAG TPA: hypothetical protein VEL76_32050 [Gemmataceae bacterium]|nr:hypothetical protein [Gemmataceae bacterium]
MSAQQGTGGSLIGLVLLGKLPDAEVAAQTGRTTNAVRVKRSLLGIPGTCDRRQRNNR